MEKLHASIDKTINDPSYQHKLAAAAELENTQGLQPIGLVAKAAPKAAAYEVAPSAPSLGGKPQGTVPPQQPPQTTEQKNSQEEQSE